MTDIKDRVEQFVKLRDKIKALDEAHKTTMKPYKDALEKLNALLLQGLIDAGAENIRTECGTVYRTEKKSASIADAEAFMNFVISTSSFDLLDRKANVTAVQDYLNTNQTPLPGINFSCTHVVGVRRA